MRSYRRPPSPEAVHARIQELLETGPQSRITGTCKCGERLVNVEPRVDRCPVCDAPAPDFVDLLMRTGVEEG